MNKPILTAGILIATFLAGRLTSDYNIKVVRTAMAENVQREKFQIPTSTQTRMYRGKKLLVLKPGMVVNPETRKIRRFDPLDQKPGRGTLVPFKRKP